MQVIKIDDTKVILDDQGEGRGEIIISNNWGYNFSYFWGAMGESLKDFLLGMNESYFTMNLRPAHDKPDLDAKRTFAAIRKLIKEELAYELPWYKHMEFQKEMRISLREFQSRCEDQSQEFFVYEWDNFVKNLDYYLIEDSIDEKNIESWFKGVCEIWHYIVTKPSRQSQFLTKLFPKLQAELRKEAKNEPVKAV